LPTTSRNQGLTAAEVVERVDELIRQLGGFVEIDAHMLGVVRVGWFTVEELGERVAWRVVVERKGDLGRVREER